MKRCRATRGLRGQADRPQRERGTVFKSPLFTFCSGASARPERRALAGGPDACLRTPHPSGEAAVTPFQRKVYEVVRKIPKGQVRSYAQIARAIGKPKAVRAVGQALKRNRWPTEIPCHRVIASDGSLGGYAWGVAAKRRLLRRERVKLK